MLPKKQLAIEIHTVKEDDETFRPKAIKAQMQGALWLGCGIEAVDNINYDNNI